MRITILIAISTFSLSAACTDGGTSTTTGSADTTGEVGTTDGPDGGGGTAMTPAEFVALLGPATCARATACCVGDDLGWVYPFADVTDQASCESFLGLLQIELGHLIDLAVTTSRGEWDGEAAAACIDRLKAMTCDEYAAEVTFGGAGYVDCRPMKSRVATGGACGINWECVSGYCSGSYTGLGVCAAMPTAGEPCPDAVCADGAQCDQRGQAPVCMALKADDEVCFDDSECLSNGCSEELDQPGVCGETTMCDGDPSDDEQILEHCAEEQSSGDDTLRVKCKLGSVEGWSCECSKNGQVVSTCDPSVSEPGLDVCSDFGCCAF